MTSAFSISIRINSIWAWATSNGFNSQNLNPSVLKIGLNYFKGCFTGGHIHWSSTRFHLSLLVKERMEGPGGAFMMKQSKRFLSVPEWDTDGCKLLSPPFDCPLHPLYVQSILSCSLHGRPSEQIKMFIVNVEKTWQKKRSFTLLWKPTVRMPLFPFDNGK